METKRRTFNRHVLVDSQPSRASLRQFLYPRHFEMPRAMIFALVLVSSAYCSAVEIRTGRQWMGHLAAQTDCNFPASEHRGAGAERVSLCNFTLSGTADKVYSWQKGLASQSNWLGGPAVDASNSSDGGYVFFETSSLSVQLPGIQAKAWLKSPVYRPTPPNGHCLRFSYNIQGVSASKLKLLRVQLLPLGGHKKQQAPTSSLIVNSILLPTVPSQQSIPDGALPSPWTPFHAIVHNQTGWTEVVDEVWLSSDSTRGRWMVGHVSYSSPYPHAFIYEAIPDLAHLNYRGHVALDNVQFSQGPCDNECEFNADFCQWTGNDGTGDFDWSLSRGSLWTHTGPVRDQLSSVNNFNFGGYAYIDSRQPHYSGSRALLTSNLLSASTNGSAICFNFWVHMYGAGIGQLRVLLKSTESNNRTEEVWRLAESGPRDTWYKAQITLASPSPYKIQVEATVGDSGYGDIAVDSFRLENGPCPGLPEQAVSKGSDCTFQNGLCAWVVTNSHPALSSMWAVSSADIFAGRPEGHAENGMFSSSNNNYLLFDTYQNGHRPGSRGFVSSQLHPDGQQPRCLSFWYYMASTVPKQPRLGALEVVLFEPNTTSTDSNNSSSKGSVVLSTTLWRVEGHQEEKWIHGQVSFTPSRGGYVTFAGIRGEGVRGIIAIDDITLFKGSCPTLPAEASVSPLDCSFDLNLCGWTVDSRQTELHTTSTEASITTTVSEFDQQSTTASSPVSRSNFPTASPTGVSAPATPTWHAPPPLAPATSPATATTSLPLDIAASAFVIPLATSEQPAEVSSTDPIELSTDLPDITTETVAEVEQLAITEIVTETTTAVAEEPSPSEPILLQPSSMSATAPTLKEDSARRISGLYDEVSSYGVNTIEVISTSRDGATKSIIISQPGRRIRRLRRSGGWVGLDRPRDGRIVSTHHRSASHGDVAWQRPSPVPSWLRSRYPASVSGAAHNGYGDGRGQIVAQSVGAFQPLFNHHHQQTSTAAPKLFAVSVQPTSSPFIRPLSQSKHPFVRDTTRWLLAGVSSLHQVRDHTYQLVEGGYVFFEALGAPTVSRLFSPPLPASNDARCLSFYFAMVYSTPNSSLTVYRQSDDGALTELWRVTSAALERSEHRHQFKSSWILARVPLPPIDAVQTIVIEGSSDSGGIALDDVLLEKIACSARP